MIELSDVYTGLCIFFQQKGLAIITYQITVVIEQDEDAYHAFIPALPGCQTFGYSVEETRSNIIEAMALHVESMLEDGESIPIEHEPLFITRLSVPVKA